MRSYISGLIFAVSMAVAAQSYAVEPLSELDAPQCVSASGMNGGCFTASWSPVPRAMGYLLTLQREHTAARTERFLVLHEDFDKIEGYEAYPDYVSSFYGNLDDYTSMPGWTAPTFAVMCRGCLGIDNSWSSTEGPGVLVSPTLDLSAASGAFDVLLSVRGCVGDVICVEADGVKKTHKLTAANESFSLSFANGSTATVLRFYFEGSNGRLLFDDIAVSHVLHRGDSVVQNVGTYNTVDANIQYQGDEEVVEYSFEGLEYVRGDAFMFCVRAWSWSLSTDGVWGPAIYSEPSAICRVDPYSAGVDDVEMSEPFAVAASRGVLVITLREAAEVTVYSASGVLSGTYLLPQGVSHIPAPASGLLIVRCGDYTSKILIR